MEFTTPSTAMSRFPLILLGCLFAAVSATSTDDGLLISSFNIRKFGLGKAGDDEVMATLVKIIKKYDLIFVQEIVDKTEEAIYTLLERVNKAAGDVYRLTLSEKVGLEQYAYIYKKTKLQLVKEVEYHDPNDDFVRNPYIALFKSSTTKILKQFCVIGVHTNPHDARYEIGNLTRVYAYTKRWGDTDVILMGDFNADCSYFPMKSKATNPLRHGTYMWVIDDDVDTTVNSHTDCAYDRFVLAGRDMKKSYQDGSAGIFNFSIPYRLNYEESLDVSDHYPIVMKLI